jgi:HEPN domain-containing protein
VFIEKSTQGEKGHSITFILLDIGIEVPGDIGDCALMLDKHYVPSRYPVFYC